MPNRALMAVLVVACIAAAGIWAWSTVREIGERIDRHEEIERRIERMTPKDHGLAPRSTFPEDHLKLQVHLDRLQMADSAHVRTRFRLTDPEETFYLPAGWRGRSEESAERVAAYDAAISKFRAVVDARLKAFGGDPEAVAGEILTAPPKGGAVPHGDVVQVLNVFLSLGMVDVVFKGPATHLPAAERAAGAAGAQPGDRGRPAGSGDR